MADHLRRGDKVAWDSPDGPVVGHVIEKITGPASVAGRDVTATPEDPAYIVESEETGDESVAPANALRRIG